MTKNFILLSSLFFLLTCLLGSCQKPERTYDVFGPEEFVCESQFILERGKQGIDELKGITDEELPEDALSSHPDTIDEGDILQILVYHPSRRDLMEAFQLINERRRGITVTDGKISLPHIKPLPVVGLTLSEARDEIRSQLRNEINDVDVFVEFVKRKTSFVEVTGIVSHALIPIDGRKRLYEVIAEIQVPTVANFYGSYVERDGVKLDIDLNRLIKEGDMSQNIVMRGGDKIYVAAASEQFALILGDITLQVPIPLTSGFLPLKQAIAITYGKGFPGDKKYIQVIRGGVESPKVYILSMDFILKEPNNNLLLIPGDMVCITYTPLYQLYKYTYDFSQKIAPIPPTIFLLKRGLSR